MSETAKRILDRIEQASLQGTIVLEDWERTLVDELQTRIQENPHLFVGSSVTLELMTIEERIHAESL